MRFYSLRFAHRFEGRFINLAAEAESALDNESVQPRT